MEPGHIDKTLALDRVTNRDKSNDVTWNVQFLACEKERKLTRRMLICSPGASVRFVCSPVIKTSEPRVNS